MVGTASDGGAYRLYVGLHRPVRFGAGRLGRVRLEPGVYVYVGSARKGLRQRVARHRRLAVEKRGKRHWHIDGLLLHGWSRWRGVDMIAGGHECDLGQELAASPGVTVPVRGFGATDCNGRCTAHLYRLPSSVVESRAVGQREGCER